MFRVLIIYFVLISWNGYSQKRVNLDTSFSMKSAYNKELKNFPFIEIVQPSFNENVIEVKNCIYKTIGDQKLHFDAHFFKNNSYNPIVLLIHGGGWKSGNKSHMKALAIEIASNGYSCFTIEYRLSPEAKYPAGILDIKSAIQFVKNNAGKFYGNSDKVAILGCSSGGQMASLVGVTNNIIAFGKENSFSDDEFSVQAIINIDGILAFEHKESREGKVASLWLGGDYESIPEIWNNASALTHVDKKSPPILFINSQFERFHAGRDDMIKQLDSFNIYYQIKTIKSSPHTFWLFHPWFKETALYITKFLDKTLKGN